MHTKGYFKGFKFTIRRPNLKENNLIWIVDTKHKTHVCSVCGNSGHNKATCKQRKLMQTDNYMWASG